MEKEFAPYELAVKLKALEFDEPCFAFYQREYAEVTPTMVDDNEQYKLTGFRTCKNSEIPEHYVSAPTFSQVFRFFRDKYNLKSWIEEYTKNKYIYEIRPHKITDYKEGEIYVYTTYEETELACLDKLIELTFKSK